MKVYRQGDLAFHEVSSLPPTACPQAGIVLAYGEVTGHAHRLKGRGRVWRQDTRLYLELERPSQVVHDEHEPLALPAGAYRVVRQREYVSPYEDREVFD